MTEGVLGFQRTARGAVWSSTCEETAGVGGDEVHFHKRSRSSHELPPPPGKKSLTFKDSPEPPLLYETVRVPRLLGGVSGLSTAL